MSTGPEASRIRVEEDTGIRERPSWAVVALVGLPLHIGLLFVFAAIEQRVFGWGGWTAACITLALIAVLTTFVAGRLGHVRGIGEWIAAGLVVVGLLYLTLAIFVSWIISNLRGAY